MCDQPVIAGASVEYQLDCLESSAPQQNVYESELSDVNEERRRHLLCPVSRKFIIVSQPLF